MALNRVMIASFPAGGTMAYDQGEYMVDVVLEMERDPRIGEGNVFLWKLGDTPITMNRNRCMLVAEKMDIDYVFMLDSDMKFDMYYDQPGYPDSKRFWKSSFDFMLAHPGPCAIAAPYCGPPPAENVYVFRWDNIETNNPNPDFQIRQYTRYEATQMAGIQPAAALATGCFLVDMRGVKKLPHPRFYYEWTDATQSEKGTTEDVAFSRDLFYTGTKLYCNWDAWCGHFKTKLVGRPLNIPPEKVSQWMIDRAVQLQTEAKDRPVPERRHAEKPYGPFAKTMKPESPQMNPRPNVACAGCGGLLKEGDDVSQDQRGTWHAGCWEAPLQDFDVEEDKLN